MAGVDADGEAVGETGDASSSAEDGVTRCSKPVAEGGALAGGVLKADGDAALGLILQDADHAGNHAVDAGFFAGADVGAGVGDKVGDAQFVASPHFLGKSSDGFFPQLVPGRCQVDEVRPVGDDVGKTQSLGMVTELADNGGVEGIGVPLLLVLGEDLDGVHAVGFGGEEGMVHAAGDRKVGTEQLKALR